MSKVYLVNVCAQCPHSRDTSACYHPSVRGVSRYAPRELPNPAGLVCAEDNPPPVWCPLPDDPGGCTRATGHCSGTECRCA